MYAWSNKKLSYLLCLGFPTFSCTSDRNHYIEHYLDGILFLFEKCLLLQVNLDRILGLVLGLLWPWSCVMVEKQANKKNRGNAFCWPKKGFFNYKQVSTKQNHQQMWWSVYILMRMWTAVSKNVPRGADALEYCVSSEKVSGWMKLVRFFQVMLNCMNQNKVLVRKIISILHKKTLIIDMKHIEPINKPERPHLAILYNACLGQRWK